MDDNCALKLLVHVLTFYTTTLILILMTIGEIRIQKFLKRNNMIFPVLS